MRVMSLLAAKHQVTIVVVARSNPRKNKQGRYQPPTSQVLSKAPVVWSLIPDEDEEYRSHFISTRFNLRRRSPGFTFQITDTGQLQWGELDLHEIVPDVPFVNEWLTTTLKEKDVPSRELYELGARFGISPGMIARAGKKLGFRSDRTGFGGAGHWYWTSKPLETAQPSAPEADPAIDAELAWLDQPVKRPPREQIERQPGEVLPSLRPEPAAEPATEGKPEAASAPEPSRNGEPINETPPTAGDKPAESGEGTEPGPEATGMEPTDDD
jgi:hypothetical protein